MNSIKLFFTALFLCLAASWASAQSDDCQIDIEDLAVNPVIVSAIKEGAGTNLIINYGNNSANRYDIPVIRVESCRVLKGPSDVPEITHLDAQSSEVQEYLCDSTFDDQKINVKIYAKQDGDVTATSACGVYKAE